MVTRSGGSRRKSRSKFKKHFRSKGKTSLARYFQGFESNDKVYLSADPSIHAGLYHSRFHGKSGTVMGKRGKCYEVMIKDKNKQKILVVHPIHLRRA